MSEHDPDEGGRTDALSSGATISNPATMFDPAPLAFSQVATVPAGARIVYVAGQVGGAKGGREKGSFKSQVRTAFENIDLAMQAAGGSIADVVKLVVYIVRHDEGKHAVLIEEVRRAFGNRLAPTCTIVPLAQSGTDPNQLIEIEATGAITA